MLSPLQILAARYLSGGWTRAKTARELKIPKETLGYWADEVLEFQEAVKRGVDHHVAMVEAVLLAGEARAAETLMHALGANGKDGAPNWNVRVQAAALLLDKAGTRGKAVERQAVVQANVHASARVGNVEDALRKALRDPGVRAWLKETGATHELVMGAEEEIVEAVISTPADEIPASAPLQLPSPKEDVA